MCADVLCRLLAALLVPRSSFLCVFSVPSTPWALVLRLLACPRPATMQPLDLSFCGACWPLFLCRAFSPRPAGASVLVSCFMALLAASGAFLPIPACDHTPARFERLSSLCGCVLVMLLVPPILCYASLVTSDAGIAQPSCWPLFPPPFSFVSQVPMLSRWSPSFVLLIAYNILVMIACNSTDNSARFIPDRWYLFVRIDLSFCTVFLILHYGCDWMRLLLFSSIPIQNITLFLIARIYLYESTYHSAI